MKFSSDLIKKSIPQWIVPEIERLRHEFRPVLEIDAFKKDATQPKNWKQISKEKVRSLRGNEAVKRSFNCDPLDDQLRLYVWTNKTDTELVAFQFVTQ